MTTPEADPARDLVLAEIADRCGRIWPGDSAAAIEIKHAVLKRAFGVSAWRSNKVMTLDTLKRGSAAIAELESVLEPERWGDKGAVLAILGNIIAKRGRADDLTDLEGKLP